MIMFDNVCTPKIAATSALTGPALHDNGKPSLLFAAIISAIEADKTLTVKVRANMKSAVNIFAARISAAGLQGPIDIPRLQKEFDLVTPAMLGFKTDGALSASKSNLRRAMRLAGIDVMPGRHVTPLTPAWADLIARFGENQIKIKLSRFAHVASECGWEPTEIRAGHLKQFLVILQKSNLGAKSGKVVRGTITAWAYGRKNIPGWPDTDLGAPPAETRFYALPWSAFPATLLQDVEKYVGGSENDFLARLRHLAQTGVITKNPRRSRRGKSGIRQKTKENYREAFRRIASILVTQNIRTSDTLTSLADLAQPEEMTRVMEFMSERTGREKGGHLAYLAFVIFMAAKHHVRPAQQVLDHLEWLWFQVRDADGRMSPRSFRRLQQFDDVEAKAKMARLPSILVKAAERRGAVDPVSVKLMRTALFTAIALSTGLRAGNIVNLELDRHITFKSVGKTRIAVISNPGTEVKNGLDLCSELTVGATKLMQVWIDHYRTVLVASAPPDKPYLFPDQKGHHMAGCLATQSLKDAAAYYAGLDMTPHAIRAYLGKVILDANPDAYAVVQAVLGHNDINVTAKYYAPIEPMKARRRLQKLLVEQAGAGNDFI